MGPGPWNVHFNLPRWFWCDTRRLRRVPLGGRIGGILVGLACSGAACSHVHVPVRPAEPSAGKDVAAPFSPQEACP